MAELKLSKKYLTQENERLAKIIMEKNDALADRDALLVKLRNEMMLIPVEQRNCPLYDELNLMIQGRLP